MVLEIEGASVQIILRKKRKNTHRYCPTFVQGDRA